MDDLAYLRALDINLIPGTLSSIKNNYFIEYFEYNRTVRVTKLGQPRNEPIEFNLNNFFERQALSHWAATGELE